MNRRVRLAGPRRGAEAVRLVVGLGIPVLVAAVGAWSVVNWLTTQPDVGDISTRIPEPGPTTDDSAAAVEAAALDPVSAEQSTPAAQPAATTVARPAAQGATASVPAAAGSWPRFRGSKFDNISTDTTPLSRNWTAKAPTPLWSVQLGEGYAGPVVRNGRVYLLDYDAASKADRLRCFALATGQELWSQAYAVDIKRNHGISRTTPAVTDKYVVTLGPKLHVMCCDATNGQVLWEINLVSQFGATVPQWYAGQCPLIDGGKAILAPGGSAMMIAVDLASGGIAWQTPNPSGWKMTHSSIIPITAGGSRQYIYCASGGVVGVSPSDGALLWELPDWKVSTANVPTPVDIGDGRVFVCGGYNAGSAMLRIGASSAEVIYRLKSSVYGSEQQTPILHGGHLYGVSANRQLVCLDLDGNKKWSSGSTKRFGLGPYMIAGGMLYILHEDGELALVEPNPSAYKEIARVKVLNGPEAWGPLAIAGGLLLVRDLNMMTCLDVRA